MKNALRTCLLITLLFASEGLARSAEPIDVGSRRELFVDDYLIESLNGTRRQMHHPVAQDVAITHDAPWEGAGSGYHTLIQDGDTFRLYYRGSALGVTNATLMLGDELCCYAESKDGVHFTKPDLGLVEYKGSTKNNIFWNGVGVHNFAPFLDHRPDCPPESRFKALGGLAEEGGLFAFQSADGIHWSLMREEPVVTEGAFDSQNLAFWDVAAGKYRAYFRTFSKGVTTKEVWKPEGYRAIRTASSKDFLSWGDEADLTYEDSPEEHLYTNQIGPYARAPHILIGFPTRYIERGWSPSMRQLPEPLHRVERAKSHLRYGTALTEGLLMASRNGVHFERWNEGFLRPGPERPGTWNYGHNYTAWNAVETRSALPGAPNELSIYATEGAWIGDSCDLRRYTIRLDGFVSVNAGWDEGEFITKLLTFEGNRLSLNFATSTAGSVRVEIQDASGQPIPGFALDDCAELFGDAIDRSVVWKTASAIEENAEEQADDYTSDVSPLAGQTVRLRFVLKDADLYALQFQQR